jgi:hypothetical protein
MPPKESKKPNLSKGYISSVTSCIFSSLGALISWAKKRYRVLKETRENSGWRAIAISFPWMISLLVLEIGIISIIIALLNISNKRSGIVTLGNPPKSLLGHPLLVNDIWGGLFYTAIPTFIMSVYSQFREATVTAVWERQPFVELARKPKTSTLRKTAIIDYSRDSWLRAFKALRNGHYIIAACAFVNNIYSLIMIPLVSYLFTSYLFHLNSTIPALIVNEFNSSVFTEADLRPAFDTVIAIRLEGATQPLWTYNEYSFPAFSVNDTSGNVTVQSVGYSANLACREVPQSEYTYQVSQVNNGSFIPSASDKGCNISQTLKSDNPTPVFVYTSAVETCSPQSGFSRLIVVSGNSTVMNGQMPSDFSFISCIPTYWTTLGNLTVSFGVTPQPFVTLFEPDNENAIQYFLDSRQLYESYLQTIQTFDAQTITTANDFGLLVYNFATKLDSQSPLDADLLQNCTVNIFASIFSIYSISVFFQPLSPSTNVTAIITNAVTRLIVFPQIAYIVLAILFVASVLTIQLFFYTWQESILFEEPVGLLGYAALLYDSNIMRIVEYIRDKARSSDKGFDGRIIGRVKEIKGLSDLPCYRLGDRVDDYKIIVEDQSLEPFHEIPPQADIHEQSTRPGSAHETPPQVDIDEQSAGPGSVHETLLQADLEE